MGRDPERPVWTRPVSTISPFRFTPDDFDTLDKKTRDGLLPLLDALNTFAQQVVAFSQGVAPVGQTFGTFSTDGAGEAELTVKPLTVNRPTAVYLDALQPRDGSISAPYSFAWQFVGAGVSASFTGLDPNTKYTFALSMK